MKSILLSLSILLLGTVQGPLPDASISGNVRKIAGTATPLGLISIGTLGYPDALMIQAIPVKGTTIATVVRSDGSFRFPMVEGEYRISFGKLPEGIWVKSIMYGSADILNSPLKLDGNGELREIRVTVESPR